MQEVVVVVVRVVVVVQDFSDLTLNSVILPYERGWVLLVQNLIVESLFLKVAFLEMVGQRN